VIRRLRRKLRTRRPSKINRSRTRQLGTVSSIRRRQVSSCPVSTRCSRSMTTSLGIISQARPRLQAICLKDPPTGLTRVFFTQNKGNISHLWIRSSLRTRDTCRWLSSSSNSSRFRIRVTNSHSSRDLPVTKCEMSLLSTQ
jgi:hypothetical protein